MSHKGRSARPAHPFTRFVLCYLLLVQQTLTLTAPARAHPTHPGTWTAPRNIGGTAVNLVLLPGGPSGYHSRVLYWDHDDDNPVVGNVFGWDPPDDFNTNSGTFPPVSQFNPLTLDDPPSYLGGPSNVFCAGQTLLSDGRLLVTGGTSAGEAGNRSGLILDLAADANGRWIRLDNMASRRWYPDNTLLPDGRVITSSGSSFQEFVSLGGMVDGVPDTATRLFQRIGVDQPGELEQRVVPLKSISPYSPLAQLSDAAVASVATPEMLIFGGKDLGGEPMPTALRVKRERNNYGADYLYQWSELPQPQPAANKPVARYGAVLVPLSGLDQFVLIGGRTQTQVFQQAWRGVVTPSGITWTPLVNYTPAVPLPTVHGLNAVFDGGTGRTNRVFIFGGSNSTSSDAATNSGVYSLQLGVNPTSDTLMVTLATATNSPGARSYASLCIEPGQRGGMPGGETTLHSRAMLFGGYQSDGSRSDALYSMWIKSATEVVWESVSPDLSPRPTARARHAAAIDGNTQSLVVYAGETPAGQSASDGWMFDLSCGGSNNRCDLYGNHHWKTLPALDVGTRGSAAAMFAQEPAFSRFPEIFAPQDSTGHWNTISTPHWQEWFPFGFVAPRGPSGDVLRIFYAGPDDTTSMLHLTPGTPTWAHFPSASGTWRAGSAVMYRPGRIMKCGTRDTGGDKLGDVFGRTAVINLNDPNPTWAESAPADTMLHRRNHNLVILPTGEVMVVGGARWGGNAVSTDANCVFMPQIWNPDTVVAGVPGHWYGSSDGMTFASNPVRKHYHSTALLLPDGRILSAGGAFDQSHQVLASIYSPYYLFNSSGGAATRPVITNAPTRVSYGERFVLCMSAADNSLSKVSFIRPAATTHGFDQNQRFVPLQFQGTNSLPSGERRFIVTAPADSFEAPPGDYMIFALNPAGTPAIAQWIQLRATNLDADPPASVTDLHKVCGHGDWVELAWSSPLEDMLGGDCPQLASEYRIRWSPSPITTDLQFESANSAGVAPLPDIPGYPQSMSAYGLTLNTQYYFRMKTKDYASGSGNWSAMSNQLAFVLHDESCGGSGGGGGCCHEEGLVADLGVNAFMQIGTGGTSTTDPTFLENTLLANTPLNVTSTDVIRLSYGPKWTSTGSRIRLSQGGSLSTRYTSVRLLGVAPTAGEELFVAGHDVVSGTLIDPIRVSQAGGRDLSARFAAGSAFDGRDGDTLVVEFADRSPGRIALETSRSQLVLPPDRTGIDIQCETAKGWSTVAHHDPRDLVSQALYDVASPARVRLVFLGEHRLHRVQRFIPGTAPTVMALEPASIEHSRSGDVSTALGTGGVILASGEHAHADFAATLDQATGLQWFLQVTGEHVATSAAGAAASLHDAESEAAPLRFALKQNRPNPFESETHVGFELPVRSVVKLEVFDLMGRRVATLANATYEPGRHSVSWDRHGNRGTRVPAGVYTCRFTAGQHQEQRQMIVFP